MRTNAAIGVVLNETKTHVLLVKRQDVPVWVLPGGGVDQGESSHQAVIREVLEETGLEVIVTRKVAEYTPINRLARFTEIYECHPIKGSLTQGPETRDVAYFPVDELPSNLFFLHREWLLEALKQSPYTIIRPLNNVTYWNFVKYFIKHPLMVMRFLKTLFIKNKN